MALKYIAGDFVGHRFTTRGKVNFQSLTLYNPKFEKIKDLIEWKSPIQDANFSIDLAPEYTDFHIIKNKIYAVPNSDFKIEFYNRKGEKEGVITYPYSRLEIDMSYKKTVLNFFKTDRRWKKQFNLIKKAGKFKTYFPAIKMFLVDKLGIYVQTYKRINNKSEFIIFDLNGKFKRSVFIPFIDSMGINIVPIHTIKDGKLYQMIENEDSESWEVRVIKF